MTTEREYIAQELNGKPIFWSQKKWALTAPLGSVATVDERDNQAQYIYAKIIFMKITTAPPLLSLTDTMGTLIFSIPNLAPGALVTFMYLPIEHVFKGNVVKFTAVGFTDFSIGYQWCRADTREK